MDEAAAFLEALDRTPPDARTACAGWTAHDLVAHLAAGAAEMADLTEATVAGEPPRATREFSEREAPYVALDDRKLRERLVVEALRLDAAVEALDATGTTVEFAGRSLSAADLRMHGRSEAALHRWDLVGDDECGTSLLAQPELTAHAVVVLNQMLQGAPESVASRTERVGIPSGIELSFASPGEHDVVLTADANGTRLELRNAADNPTAVADSWARLLALWGRRSSALIGWSDDAGRSALLAAFLSVDEPAS
jgi:hypothetical protein